MGNLRSAALACLAAGMLACGASVPASTLSGPTPPAISAAQYLGPVTTQVNYGGDQHVHLNLPTGIPVVPWTSALNSPCIPFCGIAQTTAPVVELVSFSDDQYEANGSSPTYQNVLAYVVMWRGVPCVTYGPGKVPAKCVDFFLVDAMTGQSLDLSYQFSEPA